MIARSLLGVSLLAFAVASLVLFMGSDTAHGITWKIGLTTSLSDTSAGANADIVTNFNVAAAHTNFTKVDTTSAPTAWSIALDSAVPDGAAVGQVVATSTLSVLGSACWTTVLVTVPLFDATTAVTNTVDWMGDGSNLTQDPEGNGLPAGLEQYPSFLNQMFGSLKPRARYYGYTSVVAGGAPPTQLNFVIFNPGEFVAATGWPGFPIPERQMGDALGYMNFVVLDNPVPGNAAPSTVQEFCAPLSTMTTTWGKTKGEGESILKVGAPEVTQACAGAQVGVDNDLDGTADDGCIVVTDVCGDGVDNDADGWTDEDCDLERSTNPPANSGIYGTGTHLFHAYGQSQRDYDDDGISNNEDGCPTQPDRTNIGGTGQNSSRELVSSGASSGGNECDDLTDDDGDGPTGVVGAACLATDAWCNDGCPGGPRTVEDDNGRDAAGNLDGTDANNGVGDVCETVGNCPTAADCDSDGYQNRQDNCPLVANGQAGGQNNQLDDDLDRCGDAVDDDPNDDPGAPVMINDGCPQVGDTPEWDTKCVAGNAADDDGDTVVNDGCPMVGAISEVCVNGEGTTTDWGSCNDAIGNSCDNVGGLNENVADGAYAKDLAVVAVCVGETDTDGDGWCDSTENLLGSTAGAGGENSTPEHTAIDYKVGGVPMDPVPSVCNDFQWYASGTDAIGNGPAVDNDLQGGSNAADAGCAVMAGDGTDQDGVFAGAGALWDRTDNSPSDWNPEQLNSDAGADGPALTGDASDTDDDGDNLSDAVEWGRGTDPKNVFSPRYADVNEDFLVGLLDNVQISNPSNAVGAMTTEAKMQLLRRAAAPLASSAGNKWTKISLPPFRNNQGGSVNEFRIRFDHPIVAVASAVDSTTTNWKFIGAGTDWSFKRSGTLAAGGTLTITVIAEQKPGYVCYVWTLNGGSARGWFPQRNCSIITLLP